MRNGRCVTVCPIVVSLSYLLLIRRQVKNKIHEMKVITVRIKLL